MRRLSGLGYLHGGFIVPGQLRFRRGEGAFRHRKVDIEDNGLDPDEGIHARCYACSLPIFSTPYINNVDKLDGHGNHYFLHKCCANFPRELKPELHPNSPLLLNHNLPRENNKAIHRCSECGRDCKGFFYECPDGDCNYSPDVLCAMPIGTIKIKHPSHSHKLVPVRRNKFSSNCGACGTTDTEGRSGVSYMCNLSSCSFWIHGDCALLPNTIRHRKHHFDQQQHLLYLHYNQLKPASPAHCFLCSKILDIAGGETSTFYNCTRCDSAAHVKCATSDPHSFDFVKRKDAIRGLVHLPMADERKSAVSYLLENTKAPKEAPYNHGEMKMFREIHKHPLMFHDHFPNQGDAQEALIPLCNVCVEPISPPFYSCPHCNDFFVHRCCSNLPELSNSLHSCNDEPLLKPFTLVQRSLHSPLDGFFSNKCRVYCNAVQYRCESCSYSIDVGCAFLPRVITHKAHDQTHILTLLQGEYICECCNLWRYGFGYECSSCEDFKIDAHCALLPMSVRHNFDRHPIKLITRPADFLPNDPNDDFCEICEETVHRNTWFYGCDECNHLFHVGCIPSVNCGYSRFKFGGTIRVRCHSCPLTCIQMLTSYSYTCSLCNEIVQGRDNKESRDEMNIGFECAKCGYWMHFECAQRERIEDSRLVEYLEGNEQ